MTSSENMNNYYTVAEASVRLDDMDKPRPIKNTTNLNQTKNLQPGRPAESVQAIGPSQTKAMITAEAPFKPHDIKTIPHIIAPPEKPIELQEIAFMRQFRSCESYVCSVRLLYGSFCG